MTYNDLCKHFGSASRAAVELKTSRQTVQNWKTRGRIPFSAQFLIQLKTRGRLKADVSQLLKK